MFYSSRETYLARTLYIVGTQICWINKLMSYGEKEGVMENSR